MTTDLLSFWNKFEVAKQPHVHPLDLPILRGNGRWLLDDHTLDFESYVSSTRFGDEADNRLHLSLLPVPYVGNILTADIVILLLNPGFEYGDYWAEQKMPDFRDRLLRNLSQSFEGIEFPFAFLDPKFCCHPGFMWWERKLRAVVRQIAHSHFGGDYFQGLRSLSNRLACVELVPYHSVSFHEHRLIDLLPSVQAAKHFVNNTLTPDARKGKRTIIVTRQAKAWALPPTCPNVVIYEGGLTRGAHLTPNSAGGRAILKRYEIVAPR